MPPQGYWRLFQLHAALQGRDHLPGQLPYHTGSREALGLGRRHRERVGRRDLGSPPQGAFARAAQALGLALLARRRRRPVAKRIAVVLLTDAGIAANGDKAVIRIGCGRSGENAKGKNDAD